MSAVIPDYYKFSPIGILRTEIRWRYEAPRQAGFSESDARIELYPGHGFEQALEDLAGFERIWILFVFHLNATWNPKVSPPFSPEHRKYGVFSTRSPHRPNPIGLSCVSLLNIDGLVLRIHQCDILDRTPILDIKPYIPVADAFPNSRAGWRDELKLTPWTCHFSPTAEAQMDWIKAMTGLDLSNFCRVQLKFEPLNSKKKRIQISADGQCIIHCRTWAIRYCLDSNSQTIQVLTVLSNYSLPELAPSEPDLYGDKDIHRTFLGIKEWK